mmetsp:Transcript_1381/g.1862  ORF Transcript_1381/g.1862 Transcript_1381/m.1862 type:complete len:147 (+) Transcript_1381:104-544(+)
MPKKQTTAMYFPPSQFSHRFGTQFYTIEITETRVINDNDTNDTYVVYKFTVKRGKQSKTIYYRYSEIRQLHEYLCSTNAGAIANLCIFPPKTWFKRLDNKFISKRKKSLAKYFHQLLSSSRSISNIPCMRRFLQLDNFVVKQWYLE